MCIKQHLEVLSDYFCKSTGVIGFFGLRYGFTLCSTFQSNSEVQLHYVVNFIKELSDHGAYWFFHSVLVGGFVSFFSFYIFSLPLFLGGLPFLSACSFSPSFLNILFIFDISHHLPYFYPLSFPHSLPFLVFTYFPSFLFECLLLIQ